MIQGVCMQTIKKLIARQILDAVNAEHPDAGLTEEEIARILGGIEVTEAQRNAAREMIAEYRKGEAP